MESGCEDAGKVEGLGEFAQIGSELEKETEKETGHGIQTKRLSGKQK